MPQQVALFWHQDKVHVPKPHMSQYLNEMNVTYAKTVLNDQHTISRIADCNNLNDEINQSPTEGSVGSSLKGCYTPLRIPVPSFFSMN